MVQAVAHELDGLALARISVAVEFEHGRVVEMSAEELAEEL